MSNKRELFTIIALCAIIALLIACVMGIFSWLEVRIPKVDHSASSSVTSETSGSATERRDEADAPRFCPSCGRELREGFQWGQYCPYCGEQVT